MSSNLIIAYFLKKTTFKSTNALNMGTQLCQPLERELPRVPAILVRGFHLVRDLVVEGLLRRPKRYNEELW